MTLFFFADNLSHLRDGHRWKRIFGTNKTLIRSEADTSLQTLFDVAGGFNCAVNLRPRKWREGRIYLPNLRCLNCYIVISVEWPE